MTPLRRDLILFALAFALRVIHVMTIRSGPLFRYLLIDSEFYDGIGRRLAQGDGFPEGVFFMNVLYGGVLGLTYALFGADDSGRLAVLLLQSALGAASCVLVARLGDRLDRSREGLIAAVALAVYGPAIFYDGALLTPSVLLFLTTAAMLAAVVAERNRSFGMVLALGVTTGLLILGRANNALLFPFFAVLLVRKHRSWRPLAGLALGALLVVAPVTVRNYRESGELVVVTANGGMALWAGNHEAATGIYSTPDFLSNPVPELEAEDYRVEASRRAARELTLAESSRFWQRETVRRWADDPGWTFRMLLRKLRVWGNATESQTNLSYYFARDWSWVLAVFRVHYGWILPFALIGMVTDARRLNLLMVPVFVSLLTCLVFYVSSEYRHPVIPCLLVLAASGGRFVVATLRGSAALGRKAAVVAAVLAFFVFANFRGPFLARLESRRVDYLNFGTLARLAGDLEESERFLRHSIAIDPNWAPSRRGLAEVLQRTGRVREAGEEALRAERLEGKIAGAPADFERGQELFQRGDFEQARSFFLAHAGAAGPSAATAWNNAGLCSMRLGEAAPAESLFHRAIAADSAYASPRVHLGRLAIALGDSAAARKWAREALALAPGDGRAQRLLARASGR